MKLSRKLFLMFMLISVLPLSILGVFYLDHFEKVLTLTQTSKLSQIADKKIDQIDTYLDSQRAITVQLSQSRVVIETLRCCLSPDINTSAALRNNQALVAYYQRHLENFEAYDILMIDRYGNVVFSVKQESDLGSNLDDPAMRDTTLAEGYRLATATLSSQLTYFRLYPPSNNAPAAFVVAPVLDQGRLIGAIALQLRSDRFREVSTNRTGLGISGETIMAMQNPVDHSALYTVPLRHIADAAFRYRLTSDQIPEPMRYALSGNFGTGLVRDYANKQVLAAWRYLPQLQWGMVVKIDTEEAMQQLIKLRYLWLSFIAGVIVLISTIAWIFGHDIVIRLRQLGKFTQRIAEGDLTIRLPAMGNDEIGRLTMAFNNMVDSLAERTAQLNAVQSLNQSILDNAAVSIISTTPSGLITSFNRYAEQMLGYRAAEMVGIQTPTVLHHPDEVDEHVRHLHTQLGLRIAAGFDTFVAPSRLNLPNEYDWSYVRKDGSCLPVRLSVSALRNQYGEISGYLGIATDLTEQKKTEAALREQAIHTQAILDNVVDSIITIDAKGIINSFNSAAERIFGYQAGEVIGKNIKLLMPEPYQNAHDGYLQHYLASGEARIIGIGRELAGLRKNGSVFPIELAISEIRRDDKPFFVGIIRDITERKQTENQLRAAKDAAEAANQAKGNFVANMSHEIRTPLNGVIGLSQLLLETTLDNKQRDYLEKIQSSSKLLLDILNDILDYSKIEAGRLSVEAIDFELDEIFRNAVSLFAITAERKNIELTFEVADDIPAYLNGDPLRLGQVLNNLLSNALKFTEHGEIHVKADIFKQQHLDWLRIAVRDTGIGITPEQLRRLFHAFTQADSSTTRKYGGTGLGLTICKRLVGLMDGEIRVESKTGIGSCFAIELPLRAAIHNHSHRNRHDLQRMKTLVVVNHPSSLQILAHQLKSWQFAVEMADSATTALQIVHSADTDGQPFELLLIDWKLPDMDGPLLAGRIRKSTRNKPPRVILLTSYSHGASCGIDDDMRADAILTKPLTPSDLFDALVNLQNGIGNQLPASPLACKPAALPLHGKRILLVEDNYTNQIVACGFLEKMKLDVDIAENGVDALSKVERFDYDAVLMDLHMPEMGGLEATRQIRANPHTRHLPIIAMTAAAMDKDRDDALAAGMNDHVAKPINAQQLTDVLMKWLQPHARIPSAHQSLPTSDDFDLAMLKRRFGDDPAQLQRLLTAFQFDLIQLRNDLLRPNLSDNAATAQQLAHKIKGLAGNVGAIRLQQLAIAVENALKQGQAADWSALITQTDVTEALCGRHLNTLESSGAQATVASSAELKQILQELGELLEFHRLIPSPLLKQLRSAPAHGINPGLLEKLNREIDAFNYDMAFVTLAHIQQELDQQSP